VSFKGWFRDVFLDTERFTTTLKAQILADRWRWKKNTLRPHWGLQGLTRLEAAQQGAEERQHPPTFKGTGPIRGSRQQGKSFKACHRVHPAGR